MDKYLSGDLLLSLYSEAGNMNYVSPVLGGVTFLSALCWILYGRKHFRIPEVDGFVETIDAVTPGVETKQESHFKK